mgnify:CR=1 FL=1
MQIMEACKVSLATAESILGSIHQAEQLEIEVFTNYYQICESIYNISEQVHHVEEFCVCDNRCSCHKFEQVGLPCSHLIKVLKQEEKNILQSIPINPKWKIVASDRQLNKEELLSLSVAIQPSQLKYIERSSTSITSPQARYVTLLSYCTSLAEVGSKSSDNCFNFLIDL